MDKSEVKNTIYHLTHECYGDSEVTDAIFELKIFCDYLDTGLTPEQIEAMQGHNIALIEENSDKDQQIGTLKNESETNQIYADFYRDLCDKYGKNFRDLLDKAKGIEKERAALTSAFRAYISDHTVDQSRTDEILAFYLQQQEGKDHHE